MNLKTIDSSTLQQVISILSNKFELDIKIKSIKILANKDRRNLVARLSLVNNFSKSPKTIIFKQSKIDKSSKNDLDRFARDWAGLEFSNNLETPTLISPQFYGASKKYRFILIEDLGYMNKTLVDFLMGNDLTIAKHSLERYMTILAKFHGYGHNNIDKYNIELQKINPAADTWQDGFSDMFNNISTMLKKLNIELTTDLNKEIHYVFKLAKDPGPFTALMHGDICPDNILDDPINNQMRIIDFEWAYTGNALLDAAYLRMSMPTCWCVKAFPEDIVDSFEQIYRNELIKYIPIAKDDITYYEYYLGACAYTIFWRILNLEWVLEKEASGKDLEFTSHPKWKNQYNIQRPRHLFRFKTLINLLEKHKMFPNVRIMSELILKELERRWPNTESLDLYPAFIDNS